MQTIKIKYVGRKPQAFDNVARSGKSWNGNGDVQDVPADQAKVLLKYPDQWALADEGDRAVVDVPTMVTIDGEDGQQVEVSPDNLKKPLEKMSKDELKAYAKDKFGKALDARKSPKQMIDQIEEWENDVDVVAGAQAG